MVNKDSLSNVKAVHLAPHLSDHADGLMADDKWRLSPYVPGQDIPRADPTSDRPHKDLSLADFRHRLLFYPNIVEIVKPSNFHEFVTSTTQGTL